MTVAQIDTFLYSHYLSEDGFVPYPGVTTGNALTLQEALKEEERIYANLVRRKEETRRRNAEESQIDDDTVDTDGAAYAEWLKHRQGYELGW